LHIATRDAEVPTYRALVDLLSGLSGIGRHLLHRDWLAAREHTECCALTSLVNLCRPLRIKGVQVRN
jgi:hypothetical protein